jgi:hypothetical protein
MKRTLATFAIVLGGILLVAGGVLFWQKQKVEAPALREETSESVAPKEEEVPVPAVEETESEEAEQSVEPALNSSEAIPSTKASISTADCENECSAYTEAETLKYCRVLCGLETPTYQDKDCENVALGEKDFCYKEEAVRKQDVEMCAKIKDVKLRKTCEARIAEDMF